MPSARTLSLVFAAGAVGGLVNSLAVFGFGRLGITQSLGVAIAPALTPAWLYPRIVWGGLWGFLFLLSVPRSGWLVRGLVLSLGPALAQLFVFFPWKTSAGVLGLGLGHLTPLAVLFFNAIWGTATAAWLRGARG
ncbi:MAG TPA: hypothetical protein VMW35_08805 [Myxococcota bacterium]|jgi:hypothetical protein|nr:hypothetical protein [Myxococcota bacterium]